jgi:hypothetical protein
LRPTEVNLPAMINGSFASGRWLGRNCEPVRNEKCESGTNQRARNSGFHRRWDEGQ